MKSAPMSVLCSVNYHFFRSHPGGMQDMRGLVHRNLLCFGVICAHNSGWRNLSEAPSDDRAYDGDRLNLAQEVRSRPAEPDGGSRFAMNPLPNRDYTALLLRLIPHVYQE